MRPKKAHFMSLFILTLLHAKSALCSTFSPSPFPDTVRDAPVIVRGRIGFSYSDWGQDPDGIKRLYTYYELIPSETFKGQTPSTPSLTIRELGGEKDGVGMQVPGTAQFERNEDVIVFLKKRNKEGVFDVHGMMMGKLSIFNDSNQEEYLVGPAIAQAPSEPQGHRWSLKELRQLAQEIPQSPTLTRKPTSSIQNHTPAPQLQSSLNQTIPSPLKGGQTLSRWSLTLIGLTLILIFIGAVIFLMKSRRSKPH